MAKKERLSIYLDAKLMRELSSLAARKGTSLSLIAEASIASFLCPDGSDRLEAAITRRLDRLSRQADRHERDIGIATEIMALFIRHWLTATPAAPDAAEPAVQAKGRERYQAVSKRVADATPTSREILDEHRLVP